MKKNNFHQLSLRSSFLFEHLTNTLPIFLSMTEQIGYLLKAENKTKFAARLERPSASGENQCLPPN